MTRSFVIDEDKYKQLVELAEKYNKTVSAIVNAFIAYGLRHLDDPELQAFIRAQQVTVRMPPPGSLREQVKRLIGLK